MEDKKKKIISIRVSESEEKILTTLAKNNNIDKISDYIRKRLFEDENEKGFGNRSPYDKKVFQTLAQILATCNGIAVHTKSNQEVKRWMEKTNIRLKELGITVDL